MRELHSSSTGFRRTVVGAVVGMILVHAGDASADPLACRRAIARAAATFTAAVSAAEESCARDRLAGKLPAGADCAVDADVVAARTKAEAAARSAIGRACGGGDRRCGTADDEALADIGWDVASCPGFAGAACTGAISNCEDIATCLTCVAGAAAVRTSSIYGADALPAPLRSEANRCQDAIVRESSRFFAARVKLLQRCEDRVLRGALVGPCPAGDPKTLAAITRADEKREERICKACGGSDAACGGVDDVSVAALDFASTCPAVSAGGPTCGAPVAAVADAVICTGCVSDFASDCVDALSVPSEKSYPSGCAVPATPTPTLTPTPTPTVTPPAGAPAIKCERAIVREAGRLVRARATALGRCADDRLVGKLPADVDCATEERSATVIAKAEARLAKKVASACGGGNRRCSVADVGRDADAVLSTVGWSASTCPGIAGAACDGGIVDCTDVASCIGCVQGGAVGQLLATAYAPAPGGDAASPQGRCRRALGRAAFTLFTARSKALERCADAAVTSPGAPCPDRASAALAKAEADFLGRACDACGGGDGACGGGDDLDPSTLGFPTSCPAAACEAPISSIAELAECLACVASLDNRCADGIAIPDRGYEDACRPGNAATPTPVATPTGPTPSPTPAGTCGNHVVEAGEDCDDGNVASCDECPANCRFAPVACPTAGRYAQTVHLVRTDVQPLTSALFCLGYPVGTVALPGTGLVTQRVSGFPGLTTVNDFNDAARVALVGQQQLAAIEATISFDRCAGASAPPPTAFVCDMISASNAGTAVDPAIVDCAPMTPVTP